MNLLKLVIEIARHLPLHRFVSALHTVNFGAKIERARIPYNANGSRALWLVIVLKLNLLRLDNFSVHSVHVFLVPPVETVHMEFQVRDNFENYFLLLVLLAHESLVFHR